MGSEGREVSEGRERRQLAGQRDVALVDLVDRALNAGVVISGDITISLADIDLVYLNLRLLLGSVATVRRESGERGAA